MKNKEIYAKTLRFSLLRLLIGLAGIAAGVLVTVLGYFITKGMDPQVNAVVTGICAIVGVVAFGLVVKYIGYLYKAGQIAMITRGVAEGSLPDDVVAEGKAEVKRRFVTTSVYFLLTGAIRAITSQITRGLNAATSALGGSSGDSDASNVLGGIGALISAFISIVLEYVNYCCLGWVFYNKDQNAFKSTCDGAVIYFQNWKTLLKNAGKVLAITLASLIVIGGGLCFANISIINAVIPEAQVDVVASSERLAEAERTAAATGEASTDGLTASDIAFAGAIVLALLGWSLLHSVFIKPYLLVSVMRAYINDGRNTTVGLDIYGKLCKLSSRFKKLFEKAEAEEPVTEAEASA